MRPTSKRSFIVALFVGIFLWVMKDKIVLYVSFLVLNSLAIMSELMCCMNKPTKDPTLEFFQLVDAHQVTWAHAVNNQAMLEQVLSSETMMLEADVQMRHNKADSDSIMAHPPETDSNLTLFHFLEKVSTTRKGIKLDFKSIFAVEPSLKLLKNFSEVRKLQVPIWLNADILEGPCFDKKCIPVDTVRFIELCTNYFPSAVLSIGWTTGIDMTSSKNLYTWENVIEMAKLVQNISQPVTFPVRAALVKRSMSQLLWLLDISKNLTLTIWSNKKDFLNVSDLVELRKSIYKKENVYYDLPESQATEFVKALHGKDVSTINDPIYDQRAFGGMKGFAIHTCSDVIVGQTKLMFTGKGGWASTLKELKNTEVRSTIHFDIEVIFMQLGSANPQQEITMVIGSKGLTEPNFNPKEGIQIVLSRDGKLTIIRPDGSKMENKGVSDPNHSYRLGFYYGPKMKDIMITLTSISDYRQSVYVKYEGEFNPVKQYVLVGANEQQGAVLVDKISAALTLPSGSGSAPLLTNGFLVSMLLAFIAILFH